MNKNKLIEALLSSKLVAECPDCGEEFKLSDALIFDAFGKFPTAAEERCKEMSQELKDRLDALKKRKISVVEAEKKAVDVGIGKIIEKIVPAYKEFKIPSGDCRPLFEPIDFIVFRGLSDQKVTAITFLDIKTGESRLSQSERMIRDAVNGKKVEFEVI